MNHKCGGGANKRSSDMLYNSFSYEEKVLQLKFVKIDRELCGRNIPHQNLPEHKKTILLYTAYWDKSLENRSRILQDVLKIIKQELIRELKGRQLLSTRKQKR